MTALRDLTGQVYGEFTVVCKSGPHFWRVKCNKCGAEEDRNKIAVIHKRRPCQSCKFIRWQDEQRKKESAEVSNIGPETSV